MASAQEELKKYQQLRSEIERFLPELLVLLREENRIWNQKLPEDERDAEVSKSFQIFRDHTKLSSTLELQNLANKVHNDFKRIENNSAAAGTWYRFVSAQTNDASLYFIEKNLEDPASLVFFYTYLNSIAIGLDDEIFSQDKKIQEETKAQAKEEATTQAAGVATAQVIEKPKEQTPEQKAQEIKAKQRDSVERAKAAYLKHQAALGQINALLPQGRQLSPTDFLNLAKLASDSSFAPLNLDLFFERYGLTDAVGRENPVALAMLKQYFVSLRQQNLQLRKTEGLSTKVFPSQDMQEAVMLLSRQYSSRATTLAYSTTGKQLDEMAEADPSDPDIVVARKIREKTMGTLWQPDSGAKRLIKGFTGQTKREQDQLLKDLGLAGEEEVEIERPVLFEEFLGRAENLALTDALGVPEEIPIPQFQTEDLPITSEEAAPPTAPRQINPAAIKRNADRLKMVAQTGKYIAANPLTIAGGAVAVGAGTLVAGIIAQAPGVMAFGGAIAGAGAGAIIGSVFPVIGTFVGAVGGAIIGGVGSYLAGKAMFGGPLVSLPAGISAPTLGGLAGTAATTAAPTLSAGIGAGISGASGAASTGLAATQSFLSAMQALPSLFSSLPASVAVVVGPIAVTGVITVGLVIPAIMGTFLAPNTLSPSGSGRECIGSSWPTDGTIGAIDKYPNGTPHSTLSGGVVPNYAPYNIPVYGGKPFPPKEGHDFSGSGVDISNKPGIDVYSPFAGTAIAVQDPGSIRNADGGLSLGAYGNSIWVAVDDPVKGKILLIFAHMLGFSKEIPVGKPFQLAANQFIGQIGSTGNSAAPHLHYEVVGIDRWTDIREIVPNPDMKAGDVVSRDACDTSESGPIDANTDPGGSCGPQESFDPEPDEISASFSSSGCDALVNGANAYVNQLVPGFCSGFNQPRDKHLRSTIWNKSLYVERKGAFNFDLTGGDRRSYSDMAWCTSLIIEVYKANYSGPGADQFTASGMGGVINMYGNWAAATGNTPVKASETPISDVPLGSVLFYMNKGVFTHVGMVCAKTDNTITSCEANSGSIHHVYQTNESGIISPTYGIVWYGFPPQSLQCSSNVKRPNGQTCHSPDDCQSGNCDTTNAPPSNPDIGICQPNTTIDLSAPPAGGGAF